MPRPQSATPQARKLVTIPDAAAQLGVNPKTIRRYIAEGLLPAYRVAGKSIRIRQADVDAMLVPIPAAAG